MLSVIVKTSEPALSAPRQERSRRSMRAQAAATAARQAFDRLHNVIGNFTRAERELEQARAQDQDLLADWLADPDGGTRPGAKRKIVGRSSHTLSDNHDLFLSYCNNFHSDCHLIVANAMHGYKRTDESGAAMRAA